MFKTGWGTSVPPPCHQEHGARVCQGARRGLRYLYCPPFARWGCCLKPGTLCFWVCVKRRVEEGWVTASFTRMPVKARVELPRLGAAALSPGVHPAQVPPVPGTGNRTACSLCLRQEAFGAPSCWREPTGQCWTQRLGRPSCRAAFLGPRG